MHTDIFHTTCSSELSIADMYCYDMIIFQRHFEDRVKPLWAGAKDSGAIIVYETDDDFFNIRPTNPAHKFIGNNEKQNVRDFMKRADAVIVSTNFLSSQMKCYNKNIFVMPNMIEINPQYLQERSYDIDTGIRIMYAGGPSHMDDFKGVDSVIPKLLNEFGDKIKVIFMGWIPSSLKEDTRIKHIPWLQIKEYFHALSSIQPHIGICPLEHNIFNKSKSNVKWLEYTACGAVTIASNIVPFQEVITDGVNGVLVNEQRPKDWYQAIAGLINNPDKIKVMVDNAVKTLEEKQLNIITSRLLPAIIDSIFINVDEIKKKAKKG
jgi:glycosyltransferase involved in cell wall biosynthesis